MKWVEDVGRWMKRRGDWQPTLGAILGCFTAFGCAVPPAFDIGRLHDARGLIDTATTALRSGDLAAADAAYALSEEIAPSPASIDGRGCAAFLRGDGARAEQYFKTAIARDPAYSEAYGNAAILYEVRGDNRTAEEYYRAALVIEPRNARARTNYAAFLDAGKGSTLVSASSVRAELLKARALLDHPIVEHDINRLNEEEGGYDESEEENR